MRTRMGRRRGGYSSGIPGTKERLKIGPIKRPGREQPYGLARCRKRDKRRADRAETAPRHDVDLFRRLAVAVRQDCVPCGDIVVVGGFGCLESGQVAGDRAKTRVVIRTLIPVGGENQMGGADKDDDSTHLRSVARVGWKHQSGAERYSLSGTGTRSVSAKAASVGASRGMSLHTTMPGPGWQVP